MVDDRRRRRREAILMVIAGIAFAVFAVLETRLPELGNSGSQAGNIIFFLLINLNLILLILLIFLVSRNFVKLLFERRRGILGSRLRTRLVLAFVSLALFPTLLLFFVAEGLLTRAIDNWFSQRVENALTGSLEVAHRYYQQAGENALHHATELARELERRRLLEPGRGTHLDSFAEGMRAELNLAGVRVYVGKEAEAVAIRPGPAVRKARVSPVDLDLIISEGRSFVRTQKARPGDVVRSGVPVRDAEGRVLGAVVVESLVPASVARAARRTARSHEEYRQLSVLKQPIRGGYTLTFLLITLVVLFSGSWFGFYFAKRITVPIQRLGEGMREVAHGNWKHRAAAGGDEEIATLVDSFNQMTSELEMIHSALEERRRYIENVLANVAAGVVSVDEDGRIATVNPAAGAMLGVEPDDARGRPWAEVFERPELRAVRDLMRRMTEENRPRIEQQIQLAAGARSLTAWVTGTTLADDSGRPKGVMLFLEDVTQLLRVERMEAWREVARRIAHEIKNPLTPIQLSAQRLRKRYAARLTESEDSLLDECTRTIIAQVEQLKRLVNEFSTFARLPSVEVAPQDLNAVVEDALVLFREGHREIRFQLDTDPALPLVDIDADAVKRMIINLLDNAVAACREVEGEARIELRTSYEPRLELVRLEVADNGIGMTPEVKARALEPYYSTKKDGTGLGLAIVASIASDHHAYLRMRDNEPRGTRWVIEFPARGAAALRKAAEA
jgi:two-component system nitrogen regulation sensor histidine kinase NtrY